MIVKSMRNGLGWVLIVVDKLTRFKPIQRSAEHQLKAQSAVSGFTLFQFTACPFCIKTRRAIHNLNISIEYRDIGKNFGFRKELEEGGGRVKVPCLRIKDDGRDIWLYESSEIIQYLKQQVA